MILGYCHWIDYSILLTMIIQFYVIIKAARMYTDLVKQSESKTEETLHEETASAGSASEGNN